MFPVPRNNVLTLLDDFLTGSINTLNTTNMPVELVEKEKSFVLKADLPGVAKEDIKVNFKEGVLTIEVESKQEKKSQEGEKIWVSERSFTKKVRSFNFGRQIDDQNISAAYEHGVLTLELAKKEPTVNLRQIEVK